MTLPVNVCTSVLPRFSFSDVLEIAASAGFHGIELRVDDRYHASLSALAADGAGIRAAAERHGLAIEVLSSYIGLNNDREVAALLECCHTMGVPRARLVLPRSCRSDVALQARHPEVLPSYCDSEEPRPLMSSLKQVIKELDRRAAQLDVTVLLELHWGTVMSSCSSAYLLLHDLDCSNIGITFDPANLVVEGKEDWEFGIKLLQPFLRNVHVKNAAWRRIAGRWVWEWTPLGEGMVDWGAITALLAENGYTGSYAIEDFLTPRECKEEATLHLLRLHEELTALRSTGEQGLEQHPLQLRAGSDS